MQRDFRKRFREKNSRESRFRAGPKRERLYGSGQKETSIFIYNLPYEIDKFGVAGVFRKAGRISDVYIPSHQKYKRSGKYGFVRFYSKEDAWKCINLFHGGRIRGQEISVSWAKPKKQTLSPRSNWSRHQPKTAKVKKEWRKKVKEGALEKEKTTRQLHQEQQQDKELKMHAVISGQVNHELEEWLHRSLIGITAEPRDLATLSSAVMSGYSPEIRISAISCCQFLLVFPTEEKMLEALNEHLELEQWFIEIRKWSMEIHCETRKVWLEVIGVPPQGWMWENFKLIAELWGRMICLGKSSTNTESFETMKILVATKVMQRIEAVVLLQIGYGGFKVSIKEVDSICQMYGKSHYYADQGEADDQLSNTDVP